MRSLKKSNYVQLVNYITSDMGKESRLSGVRISHCESADIEGAALEITSIQMMNTRSKADKTYHLIISFRPGEYPEKETIDRIEDRICTAIGLAGHQRISAVHDDTDNVHLHIAINKIHPERLTINEPYRAYDVLRECCAILEKEYSLQPDNHDKRQTVSQNKAKDMEAHSGAESLVSWIRTHCLEGLREASSWQEVHDQLGAAGLQMKKQGNGLIITNGDIVVKASSVARDLSMPSLVNRLGAFTDPLQKTTSVTRQYRKEPTQKAAALYDQYKTDRQRYQHQKKGEKQRLIQKKNAAVARIKVQSKSQRYLINVGIGSRAVKKLLYNQAYQQMQGQILSVRQNHKKQMDKLQQARPALTWLDWLQHQAQRGNTDALAALRKHRRKAEGAKIESAHGIDTITKEGTIIYRSGKGAVRDDGSILSLSTGADSDSVAVALDLAVKKFGQRITVNGSAEFKRQIVAVAAARQLKITFVDQNLEQQRLQQTGQLVERMHSGKRAATVTAVMKYVQEREEKRQRGINVKRHVLYAQQEKQATFAGLRTVDGVHLALLETKEAVMVKEIDKQSFVRLQRYKVGQSVEVNRGTIKHSRGVGR